MRQIFPFLALLPLAATASFATEPVDSLPDHTLGEVVIQAPRIIRKADMDVYRPSKSAVEHSANGVQLLRNLMIPTLAVNDALGTISAAGESVQLRINGRQASVDQVRNLLPSTIRRVEWITAPGLRYNGASYVLNFIVANPTLGGSLMTKAQQALNQKWGNYQASAKFNSGRSQWEAGAYFKLTDRLKAHRDYRESFSFPDGSALTRTETPAGGYVSDNNGAAWLSYNYIKPDTTVFYVSLKAERKFSGATRYDGFLSLSDGSSDINLTDLHESDGTAPSFSAYLEQHLPHRQTLVVDFGTSLYSGHTCSAYQEQRPGTTGYMTDIHTSVRDRNQAYSLEANYIKDWKMSRLTAGATYTANRNRSTYANLGGEVFHQRQDKVYIFAEYFQRLKKFTFTAGIGAQYTGFRFRETDQGNHSWNLRPQATVTYTAAPEHQFRLNFTSWQSAPSLAETNIAPQQLDSFQWRIGNPGLKSSESYMLTFNYNFGFLRRIYGTFGIRAYTSPDAITPLVNWENDRLVTTWENSRGLSNLSFYLAPQVMIVPGWLAASAYVQFRAERMRGTGYSLTNSAWSGNVTFQLTHWGFTLTGQYQRAQRDLWGERISWGEDMSVIDLSYNYRKWQFSAGVIMPFGDYDQGSKSLSRWNTNEQHMRLDMRMPYISVSYNLQWGRQKRTASRLIDTGINADRSTLGTR